MGGVKIPPISECFIGWNRLQQFEYNNVIEAVNALKIYGTVTRAARATHQTIIYIERMIVLAKETLVYE